jgi:hypothetical protein
MVGALEYREIGDDHVDDIFPPDARWTDPVATP